MRADWTGRSLPKPSPHLLCQATAALEISPGECVFIGDSLSDMEAAQAAGVQSVGYANKPGKHTQLASVGASAITEALADLKSFI
ncbi:HAD-IA family hydrolase [Amycolatopsis sp. MtRt-6]|uniref:HAD family hydrolase n=1 Tax=Amycolatopsis sp. MtRt-6 TaxID=2792782 RepID=UPI0027DD0CC9|nr:HAD-IA family hydrolase [Amycolatopsis sp. MtRt-6]